MLRNILNAAEKHTICQKAATFVEEGDTIFIDNSSTCINLYRYLPKDMTLTIITNSISFLVECSKSNNSNHTIICLGGMFKSTNLSVYGNNTILNVQQYYPDKTFMSCAGISNKNQITDSGIQEIDLKRTLIESSQTVYLLADHSKFSHTGSVYLCDCSDINYIITDKEPTPDSFHVSDYENVTIVVAS